MNLRHGATSSGDETSSRLVPTEPSSLTHTRPLAMVGPLATLFQLSLCHPVEARFRFTWIRISSKAPSARWGFVREILIDLCPASPTVAPHRHGLPG
jgi:hypothetical protein